MAVLTEDTEYIMGIVHMEFGRIHGFRHPLGVLEESTMGRRGGVMYEDYHLYGL